MNEFQRLLASNMLREWASKDPGRPLIRHEGVGALTYGAVDERADRLSHALGARGVARGDVVAVLMSNRLQYLETYYGIARAGGACLPVLPRLTPTEVAYQLRDSGAVALVVDEHLLDDSFATVVPRERWLVVDGAGRDYERALAEASPTPFGIGVAEDDLYCIRYTSGTTGRPKGSANTQRAWWLVARAMVSEWSLGADDVFLANGPFSHVSGMIAFAHVAVGGQVVLHEGFDVQATIRTLAGGEVTNVFMVPTQFHVVVDELERSGRVIREVRTLTCAAAPLSVALKERIARSFPGAALHEFYSATETPMVTNLRPEHAVARPDSVGRVGFFGGDIRILDPAGREVPPGEVGEVWVSNPMVHAGYHDRPEANEESMRDGYVSVGDLGRIDAERFLYVVGRKADMIISGGLNVYPAEVEQVMEDHPGVEEVCVYGVDNSRWGQEVRAAVLSREGSDLVAAELLDWCRVRLADYKTPKAVTFVRSLPRLPSGKVLRRQVVQDDSAGSLGAEVTEQESTKVEASHGR